MPVEVRFITDPACVWSWATEPTVRRLMVEFGEDLHWTWVMGGLAREYPDDERFAAEMILEWLEVADETGAPVDPLIWHEGPLGSTYPACMAVKAAAEQAEDGGYAYLRVLREGIVCFRRKLDGTEALVEEARRAGLDVRRFRTDLASNAIVEAFGADLEVARDVPEEARRAGATKEAFAGERVSLPTAVFAGEGGSSHAVPGPRPYADYRRAAEAAGATASSPPELSVEDALARFGRMATREIEAVCGLPTAEAAAELWELTGTGRVRPVDVLTGHLWEPV